MPREDAAKVLEGTPSHPGDKPRPGDGRSPKAPGEKEGTPVPRDPEAGKPSPENPVEAIDPGLPEALPERGEGEKDRLMPVGADLPEPESLDR